MPGENLTRLEAQERKAILAVDSYVVYQPQPVRTNVRPEAAGGLDGWLVDRLFGGH